MPYTRVVSQGPYIKLLALSSKIHKFLHNLRRPISKCVESVICNLLADDQHITAVEWEAGEVTTEEEGASSGVEVGHPQVAHLEG